MAGTCAMPRPQVGHTKSLQVWRDSRRRGCGGRHLPGMDSRRRLLRQRPLELRQQHGLRGFRLRDARQTHPPSIPQLEPHFHQCDASELIQDLPRRQAGRGALRFLFQTHPQAVAQKRHEQVLRTRERSLRRSPINLRTQRRRIARSFNTRPVLRQSTWTSSLPGISCTCTSPETFCQSPASSCCS